MMKFLRIVWAHYAFFIFGVSFMSLLPFFCIPIIFPKLFRLVGVIDYVWGLLFFNLSFIRYKAEYRGKYDKKQYIFCPNHFSYLDIPAMGFTPINCIYVGKIAMKKIPFFGFMYSRLHILVDRERLKSRGVALQACIDAIEMGKSLIIFPEGGVVTKNPPQLAPFKDGAFRAAIEKQIPVVPVTMPHSWKILPDKIPFRLYGGKVRIIFHEPIETAGKELEQLKAEVYQVMQNELNRWNS